VKNLIKCCSQGRRLIKSCLVTKEAVQKDQLAKCTFQAEEGVEETGPHFQMVMDTDKVHLRKEEGRHFVVIKIRLTNKSIYQYQKYKD